MSKKKKAGIITLYYNNDNYGGIAQAYALNKYLEKIGWESELISYERTPVHRENLMQRIKKKGVANIFKDKIDHLPQKIYIKASNKYIKYVYKDKLQNKINLRKKAFARSRELIPHSQVYTEQTIDSCIGNYDIYISGSDQIWKPGVIQSPFVFKFLPKKYKRISYASSIAVTDYPEEYSSFLKKALSVYSWISVREQSSKIYLENLLRRNIDVVVDPTLLLDEMEWETITNKRMINEKYIFAYFLGEDPKQRKIVTNYAKNNNLKIVAFPHITGKIRAVDLHFGDYQLYDVDLSGFLSLIKYADLVWTDSFHAVVFSNIYETNFFVFERFTISKKTNMNSRIYTLLDMFNEKDQLIHPNKKNEHNYNDHVDFITRKEMIRTNIQKSKILLNKALLE